MKISKKLRSISSLVMTLVMVFGLFGVFGNTIKADAATEKVKLYSYESFFSRYGLTRGNVYIQINDNASNKAVYVHFRYYAESEWEDTQASYVTTLSDGSQIWKAETGSYSLQYAIKYVGDGQTYWDNNNGNNYSYEDKLGTAVIKANRIYPQSSANYRIEANLKNLAYTKVVKVRYTEDNWATYTDAPLSYYSSDTSRGTELWSTYLSLDPDKIDNFKYCLYYQVNGQTYWDNNFGNNYDANYFCAH